MKTSISLCVALWGLVPLQAQLLSPPTAQGAVLGGVVGAVVGNNSGSLNHNAWKGAAIGAGVGALLGSTVGSRSPGQVGPDVRVAVGVRGGDYIYRGRPGSYGGHRGGPRGGISYYGSTGPGYGFYSDGYYGADLYGSPSGYGYGYGNYATNGLWLGALAGGIIGNNSGVFHHNTWRGAAWGSGLGWLLGSVAEANRPRVIYQQPATVVPQSAPTAAPAAAPVTIINNYYGAPSPMSGANGLFGR